MEFRSQGDLSEDTIAGRKLEVFCSPCANEMVLILYHLKSKVTWSLSFAHAVLNSEENRSILETVLKQSTSGLFPVP